MGNFSVNTLLIVDDSRIIIERLIDSLKDQYDSKNVLTATGYTDAVDILGKTKIDIVLLDIQLQGLNGIALLKFIVKEYPEIKVVMCSNLANDYYRKLCKEIGASCFVDKSKDFELIPDILFSI